jgi:TetR/AcrR family transcriptional repressor of nem operon
MPTKSTKSDDTRAKILVSAGQGFRAKGFGGLGVDGLAQAAGVTSGAFYAHFKSKGEAFREAVRAGVHDLLEGVRQHRDMGDDWVGRFVDFYLGERRKAPLAESCALQSLTGEVARADPSTRAVYENELQQVIAALASGLPDTPSTPSRQRALAVLAILSGAVSMARAVADPALAAEIADAAAAAAGTIAGNVERPTLQK